MHRLTFLTVVYELEYPLAALQARSISRYVPRKLIHEIILIDNSARAMPTDWANEILNEFGTLRSHVRILRADEVCRVPLTSGWHKQQILKLVVAFLVRSEFYVALDAKNHFIGEPEEEFFLTADRRPCVNAYSYNQHPLRSALERVTGYLGLRSDEHVDWFTATVTPYTFKTQWVRDLVLEIGDGSHSRFAKEFIAKDLTEFFLYAGWLVRAGRDLSETFLFHQRFCGSIWPEFCSKDGTQDQISFADAARSPIFSVHRNALNVMPAESCTLLANFWVGRKLFQSEEDAQDFIERFRGNHARYFNMLRLQSLPYEISNLRRRVSRRIWSNT